MGFIIVKIKKSIPKNVKLIDNLKLTNCSKTGKFTYLIFVFCLNFTVNLKVVYQYKNTKGKSIMEIGSPVLI
ncbi:hypothetical protein GWI33_007319 [Rhynchophorus ferrugineus]|uniref:Uncharacterized protein n=1 Tax=Rhynchophorus ferrugineus TaxID=354439 RepID=A0A834MEX5_RHYFE|nr:hypothetical protein GWI33_007319 [Rhynchophorus ferrugineus]